MPNVDDVHVLLQHPVEGLDSAIIIEVKEVVVGHRFALTHIGALQRLVSRKQRHNHAVGMTGRDTVQAHGFPSQRYGHVPVEHPIRHFRWDPLANDGFHRTLVRHPRPNLHSGRPVHH